MDIVKLIRHNSIPARKRCRVRRIDENNILFFALKRAKESNKVFINVSHGGDVCNSYGYPAYTEGCLTVAFPNGEVVQWIDKYPANKITLYRIGGALFHGNAKIANGPRGVLAKKELIKLAKNQFIQDVKFKLVPTS